MKPKIKPLDSEIKLSEDEFIVSKTDTKGRITYANRIFMRIAGYREDQLLGIQHNIIRHPDMPRGAFKVMWDELQQGHEFFAYVKNLAADGRYYWVFANVTPDYDASGKLIGYYSVRRRPTQKAIETVIPVYKQMVQIEKSSNTADACGNSIAYLLDTLNQLGVGYEELVLSLDQEG
ncbi:MAG: PAS domain-containing protein [Motiliproteus sp.]|nr:PAS domain-containing protein [Motiliproteus sp.]MCW9052980.1 PAS domain-containing protein [Motiliproteus sp.]